MGDINNLNVSALKINGGIVQPIGSIMLYPSNTIPSGWLLLNGQSVDREQYSELFNILNQTMTLTYTDTTFTLPDMRSRFVCMYKENQTGALGQPFSAPGTKTHSHSFGTYKWVHNHGTTSRSNTHSHVANYGGNWNWLKLARDWSTLHWGKFKTGTYQGFGIGLINKSDSSSGMFCTPQSFTNLIANNTYGAYETGGPVNSSGSAVNIYLTGTVGSTGADDTLPEYVKINYIIYAGVA